MPDSRALILDPGGSMSMCLSVFVCLCHLITIFPGCLSRSPEEMCGQLAIAKKLILLLNDLYCQQIPLGPRNKMIATWLYSYLVTTLSVMAITNNVLPTTDSMLGFVCYTGHMYTLPSAGIKTSLMFLLV